MRAKTKLASSAVDCQWTHGTARTQPLHAMSEISIRYAVICHLYLDAMYRVSLRCPELSFTTRVQHVMILKACIDHETMPQLRTRNT